MIVKKKKTWGFGCCAEISKLHAKAWGLSRLQGQPLMGCVCFAGNSFTWSNTWQKPCTKPTWKLWWWSHQQLLRGKMGVRYEHLFAPWISVQEYGWGLRIRHLDVGCREMSLFVILEWFIKEHSQKRSHVEGQTSPTTPLREKALSFQTNIKSYSLLCVN